MTKSRVKKPVLFSPEALDDLIKDIPLGDMDSLEDMFRKLKKAVAERMLQGELSHHLGYPKNGCAAGSNRRNGTFSKTVQTDQEELTVEMPRDREASFEPQLLPKGQNRLKGFDERVLSLYARGMSIRDIQGYLEEIYGFKVSPELISNVTIVHLMGNSLNYVSWKDCRQIAADLKPIYQAMNASEAETELQAFKAKWDDQYPTIGLTWQRHWQHVIPFLAYPEEIRRAIYTTNVIEAANRQVRKVIKTKGAFPNDEAIYKIVYLALKNAQKLWSMATREWNLALNQFAILFEERFPAMGL
jgi:transposase-like protein